MEHISPAIRIKAEVIAAVWGKDGEAISRGLGIFEKSVPSVDQDTATISVEAATSALKRCTLNPTEIGAIYRRERITPLRRETNRYHRWRSDRCDTGSHGR